MAIHANEIQTVFDRYVSAVNTMDVGAMTALYADDVHVFDLMAHQAYDGIDAWGANIPAWLGDKEGQQGCTIDDLHITAIGDLAVARAMVNYAYAKDGEEGNAWMRASWALRRHGDAWKIIQEHTSAPIDETTMQPIWER